MKIGDVKTVSMDGFIVGEAVLEDMSDGKATFVIHSTRFQMAIRQELAPLNPEVDRVFAGQADTPDAPVSEASEAAVNNVAPTTQTKSAEPAETLSVTDTAIPSYTAPPPVENNKPTPIEDVVAPEVAPRTGFAGEAISLRDMEFNTDALDKD